MASPPQNIGSDSEDGEISASGDETGGKEDAQDSSASALPLEPSEEENREDTSPQRKVLFDKDVFLIYFNSTLLYFKSTNSEFLLCGFIVFTQRMHLV